MKSFGIIHILLALILLLAYQCASAQDFVLNNKGDSISGKIKVFNSGPDKKVQIIGADKKKINIPLIQVKSFFYEGSYYHPQKGPEGYAFMKVVKQGYLSLYAFKMENQNTYDGLFLIKKDGTSMEVPNLNFKKVLKRFLSDCIEIAAKVEQGAYGKKDVELIVDEYNKCIHARTNETPKIAANPVKSTPSAESIKKVELWDSLEEKIKGHNDFTSKSDALEMIQEIKNKISKKEKVPNFLIEGLKSSLKDTDLKTDLEQALLQIQ